MEGEAVASQAVRLAHNSAALPRTWSWKAAVAGIGDLEAARSIAGVREERSGRRFVVCRLVVGRILFGCGRNRSAAAAVVEFVWTDRTSVVLAVEVDACHSEDSPASRADSVRDCSYRYLCTRVVAVFADPALAVQATASVAYRDSYSCAPLAPSILPVPGLLRCPSPPQWR